MYLASLNEEEKKNFLEVARYSMGLNGEHKEEEEEVLAGYKYECQLVDYKAYRQDEIENIIAALSDSKKEIKKIILVELIGIFFADGEMCEAESSFLYRLSDKFEIEEYDVKRIVRWVEAMNDIVTEGYELILK